MIKAFLSGYLSLLKKIGVILILLGTGSLVCYAFVWPLWYVATNHTDVYTVLALLFFAVLIIVPIVRKVTAELRRCQTGAERKQYVLRVLGTWGFRLLLALIILGIFSSVLNEKMMVAIVLTVLLVVLYGFHAAIKK